MLCVKDFVPKKSLPLVQCLYLSSNSDGILTIRATNLIDEIMIELPAQVKAGFFALIPADRFSNFLQKMKDTDFCVGFDGNDTILTIGTMSVSFPTVVSTPELLHKTFITLPKISPLWISDVTHFRSACLLVSEFASKDVGKAMRGVKFGGDSFGYLSIEATDGYCGIGYSLDNPGGVQALLDCGSLKSVIKNVPKNCSSLAIGEFSTVNNAGMCLRFANEDSTYTFWLRNVEGELSGIEEQIAIANRGHLFDIYLPDKKKFVKDLTQAIVLDASSSNVALRECGGSLEVMVYFQSSSASFKVEGAKFPEEMPEVVVGAKNLIKLINSSIGTGVTLEIGKASILVKNPRHTSIAVRINTL